MSTFFNKKIKLNEKQLTFFLSLFTFLINLPVFFKNVKSIDGNILNTFLLTFVSFVVICFNYVLFVYNKKIKIVSVIFLIVNSFVIYFVKSFNVPISHEMVMNLLETNTSEAKEFLTIKMFLYFLFLGALPSLFLIKKIEVVESSKKLLNYFKYIFTLFGIFFLVLIPMFLTAKSKIFLRKNKRIVNYVTPVNYVHSFIRIGARKISNLVDIKIKKITQNTSTPATKNNKKNLVVVVVGETTRAGNFYDLYPNSVLNKKDMFAFKNMYSCSTSTFISLPCIFSHLERKKFNTGKGAKYENLMDIFQYLNFHTAWISNNGGCKKVCLRSKFVGVKDVDGKDYDENIFPYLKDEINNIKDKDAFLVVNVRGSHHSYYKRYPEKFAIFKPECKKSPEECDLEGLKNSYNNSLYYTNYILDEFLNIVKQRENTHNIIYIYVGDHGENLGEEGAFFHGAPYFMASDLEKKIPMIMWMSDDFIKNFGVDTKTLSSRENEQISHDNIFHSLLGVFNIKNDFYEAKYDIFKK